MGIDEKARPTAVSVIGWIWLGLAALMTFSGAMGFVAHHFVVGPMLRRMTPVERTPSELSPVFGFVLVASRLMWKIERRSSGIPSIASRDRHRLESRRGGYQSIASLAIVALRGSERLRFSRPWPRSARARLDGVTPRAAAAC